MSQKFLQHNAAGGLREIEATSVGGAGQAGNVPALDPSGRLDSTMMPTGIGAETSALEAFGALAAGDFVNVFNDNGVAKIRKADASSSTAPANGFVLEAVTSGATGTVFWSGINSQVSGLTPGTQFLSTTPGGSNHVAPSASSNIVQKLGFAVDATTVNFQPLEPIQLA